MAYIEYVNQRERPVLNFGIGNGKLANDTLIFNLPAGYTCPGASLCLSKAVRGENGKSKIVDGPKTEFRCFAASSEALFPVVYNSRHSNWAAIKAAIKHGNLADVLYCDIKDSMTKKVAKVRVHESGDFYSESYLKGWLEVCKQFPTLKFYAYSKNLPLFVNRELPDNFYLTASYGGKFDSLIDQGLFARYSKVVYSQAEANALGLEIDHDDSHCFADGPFALLIHGMQPAGSNAMAAVQAIKKVTGSLGYNKKNRGK